MSFQIVCNDITRVQADAVVNAANSQLQAGGGVCGAIFRAAGYGPLQAACDAIGGCPVGQAVATPAFGLGAKYIIHAVGPIWQGGDYGEPKLLAGCYRSALYLAEAYGCQSIAFPLISAGIYGYPQRQALDIATGEIRRFLEDHEMAVTLVLFDRSAVQIAQHKLGPIQRYLDHWEQVRQEQQMCQRTEALVQQKQLEQQLAMEQPPKGLLRRAMERRKRPLPLERQTVCPTEAPSPARSLEDLLGQMGETFSQMLLRLIDQRGLKDSQVYKRANLDRKLFSKIRKVDYQPSKPTALALAIALELNLDQTRDLLAKAGYALSPVSEFDVIIRYFIENGQYDIYEINEALFYYDQHLLGA